MHSNGVDACFLLGFFLCSALPVESAAKIASVLQGSEQEMTREGTCRSAGGSKS